MKSRRSPSTQYLFPAALACLVGFALTGCPREQEPPARPSEAKLCDSFMDCVGPTDPSCGFVRDCVDRRCTDEPTRLVRCVGGGAPVTVDGGDMRDVGAPDSADDAGGDPDADAGDDAADDAGEADADDVDATAPDASADSSSDAPGEDSGESDVGEGDTSDDGGSDT